MTKLYKSLTLAAVIVSIGNSAEAGMLDVGQNPMMPEVHTVTPQETMNMHLEPGRKLGEVSRAFMLMYMGAEEEVSKGLYWEKVRLAAAINGICRRPTDDQSRLALQEKASRLPNGRSEALKTTPRQPRPATNSYDPDVTQPG
jgi:hypothetical protein